MYNLSGLAVPAGPAGPAVVVYTLSALPVWSKKVSLATQHTYMCHAYTYIYIYIYIYIELCDVFIQCYVTYLFSAM